MDKVAREAQTAAAQAAALLLRLLKVFAKHAGVATPDEVTLQFVKPWLDAHPEALSRDPDEVTTELLNAARAEGDGGKLAVAYLITTCLLCREVIGAFERGEDRLAWSYLQTASFHAGALCGEFSKVDAVRSYLQRNAAIRSHTRDHEDKRKVIEGYQSGKYGAVKERAAEAMATGDSRIVHQSFRTVRGWLAGVPAPK